MATGKIQNLTTEVLSPSVVKSSGNGTFTSAEAYRYGNVINLRLVFKAGSSTSVGNNLFVGNVSNIPLPKAISVYGFGFVRSSGLGLSLSATGELTIRVIGAATSNAGDDVNVSLEYICA